MTERRDASKKRRFFSLSACVMLLLSTLLLGISIQVPNANALDHTVGNLDVKMLTDYGRILLPLNWGGAQTVQDASTTLTFMGLVVDHDNYDHTPGSEDIADCFSSAGPLNLDDFNKVNPISFVINNGVTQKSICSFNNTGIGTGYPNDILIDQTCWTVLNKDWAIIQWNLINIKSPAADLTNVRVGLEVAISKEGGRFGLGGELVDGGDDLDAYDGTNDVYYAWDTTDGTHIGFGSAIVSDPITHYFAEDYYADYATQYVNFFNDDSWLYQRITAPSQTSTDGINPENITATVGWDGFDIPIGETRTVTMVIAMNGTYNVMITAIKDAQYYYRNVATSFVLTEFSDDSGTQRVEIYSNGREETNLNTEGYKISTNGGASFLPGNWNPQQIPTYGYSVFQVTGTPISTEGGYIGLYQDLGGGNIVLVDGPFYYGQQGIVPDPLDGESVARHFDTATASYTDDWLRSAPATWGSQNSVGTIVTSSWIVLNRVLFNPFAGAAAEGYVEIMFTGFSPTGIDISGYTIVCDDFYQVPPGTWLYPTDRFFVFRYLNKPAFFTDPNGVTPSGDNVYLYDSSGNLIDMVGWSSAHTQGYFMSRSPDGSGTRQGYNDATSQAASWVFDQMPNLMLTEFYADATNTDVEVYNPRGGDKVFGNRWTIQTNTGGTITPTWTVGYVLADGGYDDCTSSGPAGVEGDTISLYFNPGSGNILIDEVSYGTYGVAPDPLLGESTARWWDSTIPGYSNDWNRDPTDTFGSQNDVPPINSTSWVIMNEVMFNPVVDPDGKYVVLINIMPNSAVDISNYWLVCDAAYQLPTYPVVPGGFDGILYYGWSLIIRFNDDPGVSDNFFNSIDATPGDNVYFYDNNGRLLDMVGWNNAWSQGMCVRRVPDGFGTYQGYDDATSIAAGWVFNSPLQVFVTEISDSDSSPIEIELYNFWYPSIDFNLGYGFTFESDAGSLTPNWIDDTADSGDYAYLEVSGTLDSQGDTITLKQNTILVEEVSYGQNGVVPDPLPGESVQRYWTGSYYTDVWERNWSTGPNFGVENNVPPANFSTALVLNEIMFNPSTPQDAFVELYCKFGYINISGYKIVGNTEFIIPEGTVVDSFDPFYYLLYTLPGADTFFNALTSSSDNIYLYDKNGSLLDMAGWSSLHTQGKSMCRLPDGNGTRDGFDDTSSIAAGWVFDISPSIQFVKVSTRRPTTTTGCGSLGDILFYNLTITNKQSVDDTVIIFNSTEKGYPVVIFDENGTFIITEVFVPAGEEVNITIMVPLPSTIPFIPEDNITITVQSQNISLFMDALVLRALVAPFINPEKYVYPQDIYISGAGHDEITTITLNLTGMGATVELIQPQDVIFCVDVSGSMTQQSIDLAKEGLTAYVDEMEQPDQGAVVLFGLYIGGDPYVVQLMNPLTDNYTQLKNDIANIPSPQGNTPMGEALMIAIDELLLNGDPSHIQVIILLTDGVGNGVINPIAQANRALAENITIFTVGLGPSVDVVTLQNIALITGGQYFFVDDPNELPEIYRIIAAYIGDIAGRDTVTSDSNPMIRDVLPPWIELVPGSFSITPDTYYVNGTNYTILEWNLSALGIGKSWEVTFQVKSTRLGDVRANDLNSSRVYYEDYFDIPWYVLFPETRVNVLSGIPLPPKLKIDILPNKNDIILIWDENLDPVTESYLIYRSPTPTGFDFSTPWIDTSANLDPLDPGGIAVGNRLSWNHTGAADPTNVLKYSEQWYYCIRSVNNMGEMSRTSRTVGKWTREFTQGGVYSFSLPLEPIETMTPTADFFVNDMGANYIKWMDPGTHDWMIHGGIHVNDTTLEVGRGYEVEFGAPTKYTFLGMPGSHIMYRSGLFIGFDYNTEADRLDADVPNPVSGDVILTWAQPNDSNVVNYDVYRSTTRDGFDDGSAIHLATLPRGTETYIDFGVAATEGQYYYIVVPLNGTNAEGASTYSIGVWTEDYLSQYDTMGIPLVLDTFETADWYCEQINNVVGINYYMNSVVGWTWHSRIMPAGAFDPVLVMTEGYQISTTGATRFIFIGH
jgi:uncharacterized protein YegL